MFVSVRDCEKARKEISELIKTLVPVKGTMQVLAVVPSLIQVPVTNYLYSPIPLYSKGIQHPICTAVI